MSSFSSFKHHAAYESLVEKQDGQEEHSLLQPSSAASDSSEVVSPYGGTWQRKPPYRGLSVFSYVVNLVLTSAVVLLYLTRRRIENHTATVSGNFESSSNSFVYTPVPAHLTSTHLIKKFSYGFNPSKSPYQASPPSPSLDHLWKSLYYNVSYLRLPQPIAAQLPNKTLPYPQSGPNSDPGYYAANLAVFHQLHCLNSIRIGLSRAYYQEHHLVDDWKFDDKRGPYGTEHVSHCVNVLREAIMCAADTSVVTFQWNKAIKSAQPRADVLHVCRDFEGIWDWAWENKNVVEFDPRRRPSPEEEEYEEKEV
ncbi:protein of unknown function (DUF3328) domain containing protein [Naviculisporaceae sp. PSN 640]